MIKPEPAFVNIYEREGWAGDILRGYLKPRGDAFRKDRLPGAKVAAQQKDRMALYAFSHLAAQIESLFGRASDDLVIRRIVFCGIILNHFIR